MSLDHKVKQFMKVVKFSWKQVSTSNLCWKEALQTCCQIHCSQVGPSLGTRVPIGTFLTIWVPRGSLFLSKVPPFPVLGSCTRWKSYFLSHNYWLLPVKDMFPVDHFWLDTRFCRESGCVAITCNFGSLFCVFRVPIGSLFHEKLGPFLVPISLIGGP